MKAKDLNKLTTKQGYGITSSIGGSDLPKKGIYSQIDGKGEVSDVERSFVGQPLGSSRVAIKNTGICTVRIKVYRRRLADPDGNCCKYSLDAISRAGALVDDSARYIRLVYEGQEKVESNEDERVEFTLEYEGVDINDLWQTIE